MFTNRSLYRLIVVVLLVITACAPKVTQTLAPTDVPDATSAEPVFPTGKFEGATYKGAAFEFNSDGTCTYYFDSDIVEGNYTIEGDLITVVKPDETDPACQGPATYKWSFDGEKLTFAPTSDDTCEGRRFSFTLTFIRTN